MLNRPIIAQKFKLPATDLTPTRDKLVTVEVEGAAEDARYDWANTDCHGRWTLRTVSEKILATPGDPNNYWRLHAATIMSLLEDD